MQWVIRRYKPSDRAAVLTLFRNGITEHIRPAFFKAMCHPDNVALTAIISVTIYLLDGCTCSLALMAGLAWVGIVYYCCYETYAGYVEEKLHTDMRDIQASFLDNPDNCFWVAEGTVDGETGIFGMVAAVRKAHDGEEEQERCGEIFRMIVSSSCRRSGLGTRLTRTAIEFCRERKYSRIVLRTSSIQTAAIGLYLRLGFKHTHTDTSSHRPDWQTFVTKITFPLMEIVLWHGRHMLWTSDSCVPCSLPNSQHGYV